jgi:hypothetical protein
MCTVSVTEISSDESANVGILSENGNVTWQRRKQLLVTAFFAAGFIFE